MEFSPKKKSKGKFRYPRPVALSLSLSLAVSLHFSGDFFSSIVSVVPRPLYLSHSLTLSLSDRLPSLFFPSLSPANESSVGLEGKCLLHASDLRAISKTDAFFPFFFFVSLVPCVCLRGGECAALSLSLEEESFICLETPGTRAREHMKIFLHLFQLNVPSISRWITFSFPFYSCHFYFSPSWLVNNKFPPIINVRATDLPWKKIKKF